MKLNQTELRYYLKEKYGYTELKIDEIIRKNKPQIEGPLAYALGYVDFLEIRIDLIYKTLIPRSETEYWVNEIIEQIEKQNRKDSLNILDMFAGSGCIGIAILKHIPNSFVTFVDIAEDAIKQIKFNLDLNNIKKGRYEIIRSDIFEKVTDTYDYIFANPPYVSRDDEYGEEIKAEPEIALFAKDNGLSIIKKFLRQVLNYIKPKSTIYMEIGSNQKETITKLLETQDIQYSFHKDQYGKYRLIRIRSSIHNR